MAETEELEHHPTETEQATSVWSACLEIIRESVNTQSFKTWFEPIVPLHLRSGTLTVQVPSQFFYDWLDEHYYTVINSTISRVLGKGAALEYFVRTDESPVDNDYPAVLPTPTRPERRSYPPQPESFTTIGSHSPRSDTSPGEAFQTFLNPRYTFDNFIKGDSNQLARAAASAVANNPGGTSFNPLVIYGGTGLGKTHLVQAIGNYALAQGKAERVIYVSS